VVKLTIRSADGTVHEGWYDGAGRLRAVRRSADGRAVMQSVLDDEGAAEAAPSPPSGLPPRAPPGAALPRCAW
jgi:YD repeat-containing protein